jgi:hypothetical protein
VDEVEQPNADANAERAQPFFQKRAVAHTMFAMALFPFFVILFDRNAPSVFATLLAATATTIAATGLLDRWMVVARPLFCDRPEDAKTIGAAPSRALGYILKGIAVLYAVWGVWQAIVLQTALQESQSSDMPLSLTIVLGFLRLAPWLIAPLCYLAGDGQICAAKRAESNEVKR